MPKEISKSNALRDFYIVGFISSGELAELMKAQILGQQQIDKWRNKKY